MQNCTQLSTQLRILKQVVRKDKGQEEVKKEAKKENRRGHRSLFCPMCGRETSDLIEGLCRVCFASRIDIANTVRRAVKSLSLKYCRICDSFFKGKERVDVEDAVEDFVANLLRKRIHCDECTVRVSGCGVSGDMERAGRAEKRVSRRISVILRVSLVVSGVELVEEFPIEISVRREVCETCSKFVGGYYAAIIQLRAEDREPTEDEIRTAREIAFSLLRENDFISKEKRVRRGIDFYVSSSACARRISREIVRCLGGSFSESPKLYGVIDGKKVYRVSFSVRLPAQCE